MSRKKYGVGVIGCGVIWQRGHWGGGLQQMPDEAVVRYVYDIDPERTAEAVEATGAEGLSDPGKIFDAENVDIVTIATPPFARVEYVQKACAAGKHLMVEKPMARTLDDALAIVQAIRDSRVKCFIPFARSTDAVYREVAEIVRSGELGDPVAFVHSSLSGPYPWVGLDHWMHVMEKSGGPIFDYSIHFIELARACMGVEASQVSYVGADTTGRVKSDDHAVLVIEYENGAVGEFTKSWAFPPKVQVVHETTHIVCRDAVAVLGNTTQIHTVDGVREVAPDQDAAPGHVEGYRNLIAAIERDVPLYASELEGLRTNEILDAGLRSREGGRKEKVTIHDRGAGV